MIRRGVVSSADNDKRTASVFFPDLDSGMAIDIPIAAGVPDLQTGDIVFVARVNGSLIDSVVIGLHSVTRTPGEPSEPLGTVAAHNASSAAHAALFAACDEIIMGGSLLDFPAEGADGKIYIAKDTNFIYRWTGIAYAEIANYLTLGESSTTAYRGDRGMAAYDHSLLTSGNPHGVTKNDVGLGNADNTSDLDKPISTAVQSALDLKASASALSAKADLVDGVVPAAQLPGYVDDVLEYANLAAFPVTGEAGKIYVAQNTNVVYRWGGSAYVEISASLALGETSSTAYRGDRGKTAYDHSQATGNPHGATTANVADSADKRYVTDAQRTVLQNTSGTNTGDQTLSGLGGVPTSRKVNNKTLTGDITLSLASADFANQGAATQVLHGNASGNPAWGAITTSDIASASKSGADAELITGTPGTTGQLGMFNADGDLVSAGVTLSGADNKAITGTPGAAGRLLMSNSDGDAVDAMLAASAAPKLVNRQDITTNNTVSNQLIQMGWSYVQGDGSSRSIAKTITFPIAYDDKPFVFVNATSAIDNTTPTEFDDFNSSSPSTWGKAQIITTSNFQARISRASPDGGDPAVFAAITKYGFSWIAIGTKART